jgi:hypothetical protein
VGYLFEYVLRRRGPGVAGWLDRLAVPINLRDTLFLCLHKPAAAARVAPPARLSEAA